MKLDPNQIKECYMHWKIANEIMDIIYEQVRDFCRKNGFMLFHYDDPFHPFYDYDKYSVVKFTAMKRLGNGVVEITINKDGEISVNELM
jgi:hypothetical protein